MRVGLIDVDGHNFPNIPLMKISAWHKQRGDSVEWYQPMFSGHMDKVYMSKVFSFTPDYEYFVDAVLTNFDTTIEQDLYRIQLCRELNVTPYPMIYDKEHCDPVYRKIQRWCNPRIFWKVPTFNEYGGTK